MTRSPRRSWVVVAGIVAVAAIAATVLSIVTDSSDAAGPAGASPSAEYAVRNDGDFADLVKRVEQYYAAVQAGDAATALSYGGPVGDRRFLTDAALRAQAAIGRIKKVTVDPDVVVLGSEALVDVVMKVEGESYDDTLRVPRVRGRWQLPVAAGLSAEGSAYRLLGVTVPAATRAYVFPGSVRSSTNNPYVTSVRDKDVVAVPGPASAFSQREYRLTDAGVTAVRAATQRFLVACAASRDLVPDNTDCPNSTVSTTGAAVPGSARWTAPTDYSSLRADLSIVLGSDRVPVTGDVRFGVSYQVGDGKKVRRVRETVDASLYGRVDLTRTPPTYTT